MRDRVISDGVGVSKLENTFPMWIPISERLPDRSSEVLVCTRHPFYKTTNIAKASFKKHNGGFYGHGGHWANVTHWMPLPQPPMEV